MMRPKIYAGLMAHVMAVGTVGFVRSGIINRPRKSHNREMPADPVKARERENETIKAAIAKRERRKAKRTKTATQCVRGALEHRPDIDDADVDA